MENNIAIKRASANVWERMKISEMFIMTSDYEGMSNALIEAMCLGLPCISTKVSGAVELIKHNQNGLLINIGSTSEAEKAMGILADDKGLRYKLGKNAVKVIDDLNVNKIARQYIGCIDKTINS